MPDQSVSPTSPAPKGSPSRLADRLRRHVEEASAELGRHPAVRGRKNGRRAPRSSLDPRAAEPRTPEQLALRAVFRQLGVAYRQHRRRTGAAVFAPLRSAAIAFRQQPSFDSLLPVAVLMEELALLEW